MNANPAALTALLTAPEHSRSDAQAAMMQTANTTGICPLCRIDWQLNKLIRETPHWFLMWNLFPYPHHEAHMVLFPKRHIVDIGDVSGGEWSDWGKLNAWAIKEFKLPGGGLVLRFGPLEYSAGTIPHLHSHIQVPDQTGLAIAVFQMSPALAAVLKPVNAEAVA